MLAVATNYKNNGKIIEKMHVFWDVDFRGIVEGFWKGFGRPKSMIFAIFWGKNGSNK